jgi:hypothetical protein
MKQTIQRVAVAAKALLLNSVAAYAQQDTTNRLPPAETSPATWVTRPWFWVGGLIILVCIYMIYARWARRKAERVTGLQTGE